MAASLEGAGTRSRLRCPRLLVPCLHAALMPLAPFPFSITTSIYELQSPDPPTHRCPADSPRRRAEDGAAHGPADAGTRSQWWSAPGAGAQRSEERCVGDVDCVVCALRPAYER